jgi:hypothetical protein
LNQNLPLKFTSHFEIRKYPNQKLQYFLQF